MRIIMVQSNEKIAEEWVVSELAGRWLSKPPCE
jgi:hypothetical protein